MASREAVRVSAHRVFGLERRIAPAAGTIAVTLVCRRNPAHDHRAISRSLDRARRPAPLSPEAHARIFGATGADIRRITAFARRHGLKVIDAEGARHSRLVRLAGEVPAIDRAFGISLGTYDVRGRQHRGHHDPIAVPASIAGVVEAVLGLDDLPVVRRPLAAPTRAPRITYTPDQLAAYYAFPDTTGAGEVIGLVEITGGYDPRDLEAFFGRLRRHPRIVPTGAAGHVPRALVRQLVRSVRGQAAPLSEERFAAAYWAVETTMGIELAGALAPDATIRVHLADADTSEAALRALRDVIHSNPRPTILSLSWALDDANWRAPTAGRGAGRPSPLYRLFEHVFEECAALGITVCCASGDFGSAGTRSGGRALEANYPAASRYVMSCGGTTLLPRNGRPARERVWNARTAGIRFASGGGFLADPGARAVPSWQKRVIAAWRARERGVVAAHATGRGVPDVASDADFNTGCQLLIGGLDTAAGGTSASAPLWAALLARVNAALVTRHGTRVGFVNPALYTPAAVRTFRNIATGSNSIADPPGPFSAVAGTWDPCTGLGTPDGRRLLEALERVYGRR